MRIVACFVNSILASIGTVGPTSRFSAIRSFTGFSEKAFDLLGQKIARPGQGLQDCVRLSRARCAVAFRKFHRVPTDSADFSLVFAIRQIPTLLRSARERYDELIVVNARMHPIGRVMSPRANWHRDRGFFAASALSASQPENSAQDIVLRLTEFAALGDLVPYFV